MTRGHHCAPAARSVEVSAIRNAARVSDRSAFRPALLRATTGQRDHSEGDTDHHEKRNRERDVDDVTVAHCNVSRT